MAATLLPFRPLAVKATASSAESKAGPAGRRSAPSSSSFSANWWAPIFCFSSSEPGYIDSVDNKVAYARKADLEGGASLSEADAGTQPARSRPNPIRLTEEKARLLRLMTSDAASLHDRMYHSAIASRLASDFGNRIEL